MMMYVCQCSLYVEMLDENYVYYIIDGAITNASCLLQYDNKIYYILRIKYKVSAPLI